jgi:hypothetical protein
MPYTDPVLDDTVPPSTEKIKLGASRIRALTNAIKERLASIFVDPDSDPLVIKPKTIELAMLTDAARLGLFKIEQVEYVGAVTGFAIGVTIPAGHDVDQHAMTVSIKTTNLPGGTISALTGWAYGSGANIVLNIASPTSQDFTGTTFIISIFTPVS